MKRGFTVVGMLTLGLLISITGCNKSNTSGDKAAKAKAQPTDGGKLLGKPFTVKATTELAKVLGNPKSFEGKTIRVQGVVVAHCHHKKRWFAVALKKGDKQKFKITTKPAFLVPADVKHGETMAEAEGVVTIQTVPEKYAKHLAHEHGLFGGDPAKISGPQFLPSLKATGARFK